MSYKDIIPQLGLPDELNKRLEDLLSLEKERENAGEGTFHPGFKGLNSARKQFRKAYRKIRKHSPSNRPEKKNSDSEDDLNLSISSSDSVSSSELVKITDPDEDMMRRLPGILTDEEKKGLQQENEQLKYLENKYLQKKLQLEQALKDLEEEDKVDEKLLKSIASEVDLDTDGYDFEAENEELDRIINELKEMTKEVPNSMGKIEEVAD